MESPKTNASFDLYELNLLIHRILLLLLLILDLFELDKFKLELDVLWNAFGNILVFLFNKLDVIECELYGSDPSGIVFILALFIFDGIIFIVFCNGTFWNGRNWGVSGVVFVSELDDGNLGNIFWDGAVIINGFGLINGVYFIIGNILVGGNDGNDKYLEFNLLDLIYGGALFDIGIIGNVKFTKFNV